MNLYCLKPDFVSIKKDNYILDMINIDRQLIPSFWSHNIAQKKGS